MRRLLPLLLLFACMEPVPSEGEATDFAFSASAKWVDIDRDYSGIVAVTAAVAYIGAESTDAVLVLRTYLYGDVLLETMMAVVNPPGGAWGALGDYPDTVIVRYRSDRYEILTGTSYIALHGLVIQ